MFEKAKKLNKFISSLFMVALFGFFACTIHIFPSDHKLIESDKVAHHHDSEQDEAKCVDHDTALSYPNKYNHSVLDQLVINNIFVSFNYIITTQNVGYITFEGPPPKNKVPIFIKNNIFLI